jgi:hypothetical protein
MPTKKIRLRLTGSVTLLSQRDEYRSTNLLRREQEIHVGKGRSLHQAERFPTTHIAERSPTWPNACKV